MKLFGFEIRRKNEEELKNLPAIAPPNYDDGALTVSGGGSGASTTMVDLYGAVKNEAALIDRYRTLSFQPEVDTAIDEIVNDAICIEPEDKPVKIVLDDINLAPATKKIIEENFEEIIDLLNFNKEGYNIFRRWYIDGRLRYHAMINPDKREEGLKELRYLDSRKIRKIRQVKEKPVQNAGPNVTLPVVEKEFYLYSGGGQSGPTSLSSQSQVIGITIAKDSIVEVTSGVTNVEGTLVLSYLHKALRVATQLRMLEDAVIIYRLSRAPERRVWYIDVGNLPKVKAEQYVRDIMTKHKNRLIYDPVTGNVKDDRKFTTMLEDYWLPRREGGKGTEVSTLPAGQSLNQLDEVEYFQKLLYTALYVPTSRLNGDSMFGLGKPSEITRDELKFAKFITRLRVRFSDLFTKALGVHLILKNHVTPDDWDIIKSKIKYKYSKDNYTAELKYQEITSNRFDILEKVAPWIGRFISNETVQRSILMFDDEQIEKEREKILDELADPIFNQPLPGMEEDMQENPDEGAQQAPSDGSPKDLENSASKIANAQTVYNLLKRKTKKTEKERTQFRSAAQILGKNKSAVKKTYKAGHDNPDSKPKKKKG